MDKVTKILSVMKTPMFKKMMKNAEQTRLNIIKKILAAESDKGR